jgi:hypothetical protein
MDMPPMFVPLDDHAELLADLERARVERDRAEEEFQRLRSMVLKLLPDPSEAPDGIVCMVNGDVRVVYAPSSMRHLDQHLLRQSYPAVVQACTTYVTRWSLRFAGSTP